MRLSLPSIMITDADLQRLRSVLDQFDTPAAESLDAELHRAVIVGQDAIPDDVVTMGTEVVYEDCDTATRRTVTIVYPNEANAASGKVSVLAPIGCALLGMRVGQSIEWEVPHGTRRVRVIAVGTPAPSQE